MKIDMLIEEIAKAIAKNEAFLSEALINEDDVTPQEIIEYFSDDTPTGDTTTINDVLEHPWLLLHEIVELKNLKLKGFIISRKLVWDNYLDVLEAHIAATSTELRIAKAHGDFDWVSKRVKLIPSWLEDTEMPELFKTKLLNLMEHYQ
jgi:hypothetical protein